jgi:thioredoxin-related protein
MKHKLLLAVVSILILSMAYAASRKSKPETAASEVKTETSEGIKFFEGTWKEVVKKAKETNKPIMVDVSTSWCGYCKKMKRFTFTDNKVAAYYNENFINIEVDAENGDGLVIAQKYQVRSYPTIIYFDKNEKVILFAEGYMQAGEFVEAGKAAYQNLK